MREEILKKSKQECNAEGKAIIENLMDRGLTKKQIAKIMYMTTPTLNKVINGERDIKKIEFKQLLETEEFLKENSLKELKEDINGEICSEGLANWIMWLIYTEDSELRILRKIAAANEFCFYEDTMSDTTPIWDYVVENDYCKEEDYYNWSSRDLYDDFGKIYEPHRLRELFGKKADQVFDKLNECWLAANCGYATEGEKLKIMRYVDSVDNEDPDVLKVKW